MLRLDMMTLTVMEDLVLEILTSFLVLVLLMLMVTITVSLTSTTATTTEYLTSRKLEDLLPL